MLVTDSTVFDCTERLEFSPRKLEKTIELVELAQ